MLRLATTIGILWVASVAAAQEARPPVRVATYNVLFQNRDLEEVARTIAAARADFVALQETNAASEAFLRRRFGTLYPHALFRRPPAGARACGYGVLSRVPVREFAWIRNASGMCGQWILEAELAGRRTRIANLHLQPFRMRGAKGLADLGAGIRELEDTHAREMAAVLAQLEPSVPTIVLGDLNSLSTFHAPSLLRARGLIDAIAARHRDPDALPTWSGRGLSPRNNGVERPRGVRLRPRPGRGGDTGT